MFEIYVSICLVFGFLVLFSSVGLAENCGGAVLRPRQIVYNWRGARKLKPSGAIPWKGGWQWQVFSVELLS